MDDERTHIPAESVDIIIEQGWGQEAIPLPTWIEQGYPPALRVVSEVVFHGSREKLPFYSVPLHYRNVILSHFLLASGMLHDIPDNWKNLTIEKQRLTTNQTIGEIALAFAEDGIRLTSGAVQLHLPPDFAIGTVQAGHLNFLVFTDSADGFNDHAFSEAAYLGTIFVRAPQSKFRVVNIDASFERHIPDTAYETLMPMDIHNSAFQAVKALLAESTMHKVSLALCHANTVEDAFFSYYAIARSRSHLEGYSARILNT